MTIGAVIEACTCFHRVDRDAFEEPHAIVHDLEGLIRGGCLALKDLHVNSKVL